VASYREIDRDFAIGDRIQLTAPNRELGVANRDLGTIQRFGDDGRITVSMDGGKKTITFDPHEMRHFDHGYAVTSHSSQGLTSERVLVNMDTQVHPELINWRNDYVAVEQWSRNIIRDRYVFLVALHEQHEHFARTWDANLKAQGYLAAFSDKYILG
jgi:hypothetical protein